MKCLFCKNKLYHIYNSIKGSVEKCINCNGVGVIFYEYNCDLILESLRIFPAFFQFKKYYYSIFVDYLNNITKIDYHDNSISKKVLQINRIIYINPSNFDDKLKLYLTFS